MRADAQRNRGQILRAARDVFVAEGPDAPLDEIARRAGVGIATLYRRFPNREDLIRAVAIDTLADLDEAAVAIGEREKNPFEALRLFMHMALDLKVGAVLPSIFGRFVVGDALLAAGGDAASPVQEMIEGAQAAGLLRKDVVLGDIALMVIRMTRPLPGGGIPEDKGIAHRQLEIYVDGLRPAAARERTSRLPEPAVGIGWFRNIRERIARGTPPKG